MVAAEGLDRYKTVRDTFAWKIPEVFNIGVACVDVHRRDEVALIEASDARLPREVTFGEISAASDRVANALVGLGLERGDRIALVLPQRLETAVLHVAIYKMGAVAVPLSVLFGEEALSHRIGDSGARLVVTDDERLEQVTTVCGGMGGIVVVAVGDGDGHARTFADLERDGSTSYDVAPTAADTPALLIYTSGTTGAPKGALHAHRVLLGHLPGFVYSHDGFPHDGDRVWTPADWAWIGGLMDALLPSWFHGRPVVCAARAGAFDPEWAARLIERHAIRNAFIPPTALRMMAAAGLRIPAGTLRSVGSGGEVLGERTLAWAREDLGVTVNEFYGQTESNYVVGNSASTWPVRPGSMGLPFPGHDVRVLLDADRQAPAGRVGEICVRMPDPVSFLGYWGNESATEEKLWGEWLRTGDLAETDTDGYLYFRSRADDIISSAGYRIGPEEVEACLQGHPSVALAGVIGIPDPVRGQAVKAYVQLLPGLTGSDSLKQELSSLVRERLAAYEYPREIEFVEALPLTTTGKIRRLSLRDAAAGSAKEAGV